MLPQRRVEGKRSSRIPLKNKKTPERREKKKYSEEKYEKF